MSTVTQSQYSRSAPSVHGQSVRSVAVIGPGRVGTAVARALLRADIEVTMVGAGDHQLLEMMTDVMTPGARVADLSQAVAGADVVVLAVPLHKVHTVDPAALDGAVVVDVMNYWEPNDGYLREFAQSERGTSPVVADMFPAARIVKTLNHLGYHDIDGDTLSAGHPDRRALAVMGDDAGSRDLVASMVDAMGFDPVDGGTLSRGVLLEAGGDIFGRRLQAAQLRELLAD